jgi:acyl-coenzyme A synthetase/AMP-(fatty) acid ligase
VKPEHLPSVIERAGVTVVVGDDPALAVDGVRFETLHLPQAGAPVAPSHQTEWVLFTSGTTGVPKMVAHTLKGLSGAIKPTTETDIVWGTFYDIRRYGGLQILLRALLGNASLVLSDAQEDVADFLARLAGRGVTHLTGTPSHWRRALMSPANGLINPRYVRLSGEIADQAILDSLKARFPDAAMGHAYASTEAGVGFEVTDGREGFPATLFYRPGPVEMKVLNGTLHVRSPRTASTYVGGSEALMTDGWVDTGDMVERRGERLYFVGRTGGIINVGGLKINPEEVEAVINRHPGVRMSRVSGRKSPITGAIVVADVVLADPANDNAGFKQAILDVCREKLPAFKVPAMLRFVPALELTAGGKLSRFLEGRHG